MTRHARSGTLVAWPAPVSAPATAPDGQTTPHSCQIAFLPPRGGWAPTSAAAFPRASAAATPRHHPRARTAAQSTPRHDILALPHSRRCGGQLTIGISKQRPGGEANVGRDRGTRPGPNIVHHVRCSARPPHRSRHPVITRSTGEPSWLTHFGTCPGRPSRLVRPTTAAPAQRCQLREEALLAYHGPWTARPRGRRGQAERLQPFLVRQRPERRWRRPERRLEEDRLRDRALVLAIRLVRHPLERAAGPSVPRGHRRSLY
jgi:hypothetical protein